MALNTSFSCPTRSYQYKRSTKRRTLNDTVNGHLEGTVILAEVLNSLLQGELVLTNIGLLANPDVHLLAEIHDVGVGGLELATVGSEALSNNGQILEAATVSGTR